MPTSRMNRTRAEIVSGTVEYLSELLRVCTRQERNELETMVSAAIKCSVYSVVARPGPSTKTHGVVTVAVDAPNEFLAEAKVTGGSSRKLKNLVLDLPKFLRWAAMTGLAVERATPDAVRIALIGLALWDLMSQRLRLALTDIDAIVFLTMWTTCDEHQIVLDAGLLQNVNARCTDQHLPELDATSLGRVLEKLELMGCIEANGASWHLAESVTLRFERNR